MSRGVDYQPAHRRANIVERARRGLEQEGKVTPPEWSLGRGYHN
jgi:hypothetical protein